MLTPSYKRRLCIGAFFGVLLLLGWSLHRDYGVSWDEPIDHLNGAVSGRYVAELLFPTLLRGNPALATIPPLANYGDNDHGVLFELPVAGLGFLFTHGDSQAYFFMRHLLIFMVFVGGVWALYRLGCLYYRNWRLALLAGLLLVLSPRIFAEAFFNGKDIPFMCFFALGVYTLTRLLLRPTWQNAAAHALATAAAIAMRVPGVLLLGFTAGMVLLEIIWPIQRQLVVKRRRRWLALTAGYAVLTAALTVLAWPALWANPVVNFSQAFHSLSHYNWPTKTSLYLGQYAEARQLPWHYVPVWVASTTPLLYLVAAFLGLAAALYRLWRGGWAYLNTWAGRLDLLMAGWLMGPWLTVVLLNSVLYNGWRHLYFLYPALVLWAVRGVQEVWLFTQARYQAWRLGILGLAAMELLHIAGQMAQLHPYEHMYFSVWPSQAVERLMERDYWGLCFREGLTWILAHDSAPQITINAPSQHPLYNNTLVLTPLQRARIQYRPDGSARYYITNYRRHPQSYLDSLGTEVYVVRAGGVKLLSVFKRP